jgi:hypothetical protein
MRKSYFAVPLLIALFLSRYAAATTVVYIVTPTGIVVGADGKATPTGTVLKIFLLRGKYVLANVDIERAESKDGGTVLYDFPTWTGIIDGKIRPETTVAALSLIVENEMPKTFSFAIEGIKSGAIEKGDTGLEDILVSYMVAGYESGVPAIYNIWFNVDWNQKTVIGPHRVLLQPEQGQRTDSRFGLFGQHVALSQLGDAQSNAHKKAVAKLPLEYQALDAGKELTLKQASNFVRALLAIEAEANPKFVGFPITVVTIPRIGRGWVRKYKTDVSTFSSLPKSTQWKQPTKHN